MRAETVIEGKYSVKIMEYTNGWTRISVWDLSDRLGSLTLPPSVLLWVIENIQSPQVSQPGMVLTKEDRDKLRAWTKDIEEDLERVHRRLSAQIELYKRQPAGTKVDAEEIVALLGFIKG
jgi:hypothetical protein